jgi:hypothetical protein
LRACEPNSPYQCHAPILLASCWCGPQNRPAARAAAGKAWPKGTKGDERIRQRRDRCVAPPGRNARRL